MKVTDFEKAVNDILKAEIGLVNDKVREIAGKVAKETVQDLKSSAPIRTGKYRKSFRITESEYGTPIVHSKKHYRLTHLLEFGHDIIKNGVRVGRTKGVNHWANAEEKGIREFEKRIKEAIENG